MSTFQEPARTLPATHFDVVIAGGGTTGVVAALAAARQGAKTALIEAKGYTGGIAVEGGTALHSFFNLWKAFPGVEKKQIVKGIPQEIIDRLEAVGGTTGHCEMDVGYGYDSVCTAIDTELYKLVTHEMLEETGVALFLNTWVVDAVTEGSRVKASIIESRSGREALLAHTFIEATGYGDLAGRAGAPFIELNDHPVANSIGVGGVDVDRYRQFFENLGTVSEHSRGPRSGSPDQTVRVNSAMDGLPEALRQAARDIGMAWVTTTVHDDYFMFIKLNVRTDVSPTDRDAVTAAELELRRRQQKAIQLLRTHIPGCEKAFIARTSPSLCIRRGRTFECDYDITSEDVLEGRHFPDEVMVYGFHDLAPRLQVKDGGTYGIPYRALRVVGFDNLLAAGMVITSDFEAHMSTRNTVCCMGQGQAAGTAAALCAAQDCTTRELSYPRLRETLVSDGVYLEN